MKILYLENASWEIDFITKDILFNISNKDIEFFSKNNFMSFLNRPELINNNILVINYVLDLNDIIKVIKYIKPICIFWLSDESGDRKNANILENYTKILFRQHNFKHYNYYKNNYHIPLGYSTLYLNGKPSSIIQQKRINEREFNVSFIGQEKSDRLHMANIFRNNMKKTNINFVINTWNVNTTPFPPQKCFDIYNNSIFVISGRGAVSLDCFRVYEAIVAGAIPVIVGNFDEIKTGFTYNTGMIPCIYDDTWEKVVIKCNDLLNDMEKLQKIQDTLLLWWNNEISFISNLIIKEINNL